MKLFKYTHSKKVSTQCAFYGWDVNPVQKKTKKGQKISIRSTLVNGIYWFGLPTYTFIRLHSCSKYWIWLLFLIFVRSSIIVLQLNIFAHYLIWKTKSHLSQGVKLFMKNSHFKAPGFLQRISSISILLENKCLLSIYKIKQLDLKR